ncbi:MAG: glycosyltransferase [Acidimicrobiales bacterium]|nr:glycosyltransferase [Acidimicrobiales bacterium]MDG2217376.1 glycosyltransferase [Acidimicrobiales bacterium]
MPVCAFVSFRLGMADGVSVVTHHWQQAFEQLGFETLSIAGEGPVNRTVPGLAIGAEHPPQHGELAEALADADLVVVENLCSIPLNLAAARLMAEILTERPAVMHHHDPPWQRERFRHITEVPHDRPGWRHVTINQLTQQEFSDRGIDATCIYNGFPTATSEGDRLGVRSRLRVAPDARLFAHPVRAIARKDIAGALRLCEQLDATYWLWGSAEDGYGDELERLLTATTCPVVRGTSGEPAVDLYSAADAVVFPSLWEGFGNPPIEAAIHQVPAAVANYPVARELVSLGMDWFPTDDPGPLGEYLAKPEPSLLDRNREVALANFSLEAMTSKISALLADAGWLP